MIGARPIFLNDVLADTVVIDNPSKPIPNKSLKLKLDSMILKYNSI